MKQHLGEVEITSFPKMSDKKVGKHPQVIWDCLQVPITTPAIQKTLVPIRNENVINRRPWHEWEDSMLAVWRALGLLIAFSMAELYVGGSRLVLFMAVELKWPVDNDHIHLPLGRHTPVCLQPESQYENRCRSIGSQSPGYFLWLGANMQCC